MQALTASQLRRAFDFLDNLRECNGLDNFGNVVVGALARLIDCDLIGFNEIAPGHGRLHAIVSHECPEHREIEERWTFHQADHPTFQHSLKTGDNSAWRISDFLTRREFRQTGLYAECYRLIQGESHLSVALDAPPGVVVALAFNRSGSDFAQSDRELLNLVRPHLSHAYQRALATTELARRAARATAALEAIDDGVLGVADDGAIAWATPRARTLLARHFATTDNAALLPPRVKTWLAAGGPEPLVLAAAAADGRLVVNAVPGGVAGERLLLLSERRALPTSSDGLATTLKLTAREADVLLALMHGHTNSDVARALACSPRTIEKHVENLFRKLDVTTRTAAVARAMQALSDVR